MNPYCSTEQPPSVDMTAKHPAQILEKERSFLRSMMESIPDDVYFKDRDSRFIAISGSKARRHGMEPAAMVGKSDFDLFTDRHARKAFDDEQRIMLTGQSVINQEERERREGGRNADRGDRAGAGHRHRAGVFRRGPAAGHHLRARGG